MQDERLVVSADGWYFRIRGGQLVGLYAHREQARVAVRAYRDACVARVRGARPWSLWRRPKLATPNVDAMQLTRA